MFPGGAAANVQWNFQINQASQISSETRDNDGYAFTGIAAVNKAYSVNGLNQYSAVAGTGYLYDASGNLTYDGFNAFTYDGENRLVSALAAGQTTTLTYDPLGRLFQTLKTGGNSVTRSFLYDGDALVAEYNQAGTLVGRYVHGSNAAADDPLVWYTTTAPSSKRYLHADHLGSIVAATNTAAAPSLNAYDEYGVPRSGNVGRFQYTGQIWLSELGLYHYKARLYSPTLGRFLQTDPVGYEGGVNLYAYVGDDPLNESDPEGLDCTGSRIDCSGGVTSGSSGASTGSFTGNPRTVAPSNLGDQQSHIGLNGFPQDGPPPQMMITGDTGAMMQDAIEENMVMQHQMTQSEHQERRDARANGALTGLSIVEGGVALRAAGAAIGRRMALNEKVGVFSERYGNRFFRSLFSRSNAGSANQGFWRRGWSYNARTGVITFQVRIGRFHLPSPIKVVVPEIFR